ncbi:MAG TPA: DMT family transporter [Rhodospirillales bacterium]|jgi:drug/metabolite transporter (DMT)-like permease|nr:DMT family transporter [Rhodospirillales bacterium]HJO68155.1 DMT family transporter [Rhodospirillales bacterium]
MARLPKLFIAVTRLPAPVRGAFWMVAGSLCLTSVHGLVRHVSLEVHPFEIAFFRYVFGTIAILPWVLRAGLGSLRTERFPLHVLRCSFSVGVNLTWFMALALMPLADATALSFTSPLFVTVGAALVLGESVRARRWTATMMGFAGAAVILRPGVETISWPAVLALTSAAFGASSALCVRALSSTESARTIVAYQNLLVTMMTALPALLFWSWPGAEALVAMALMGILATLGHLALARGLAIAEASAMAPFNFSRLIFAAVIGRLFFGEAPDTLTWVGAVVIFGATVFTAHAEARGARGSTQS